MNNDFFADCVEKHGFCFIAEISNNHLVDLNRYLELIEAAHLSGAHAVKIQTYSPSSLLAPSRLQDIVQEGPWKGQTYHDLYSGICAPKEWTGKLFDYASERGIFLFSSPFSEDDVELLEKVNCPAYKIASFEFTDVSLWTSIAKTSKPILASTGISSQEEISRILTSDQFRHNCSVLFNCVSAYPSNLSMLNVDMFSQISNYGAMVGLSDHSLTSDSSIFSYAFGARVFEKHFTLRRSDGGPDSQFSLEPAEVSAHIQKLKSCSQSTNLNSLKSRPGESYGRVTYAKDYICQGEPFTPKNCGNFRPFKTGASKAIDYFDLLKNLSKSAYSPGDFIKASELE